VAPKVSFHEEAVKITDSMNSNAYNDPQLQGISSILELPAQHPFFIPDVSSLNSSEESLTTCPQSPTTLDRGELKKAYHSVYDEIKPFEEGISLNMEVDPGTIHVNKNTQEPCSADIGVQTSVKMVHFGCGNASVEGIIS
jgi:hypothetical protein